MGVQFGEAVHWKECQAGGALAKFVTSWKGGLCFGVKGETGELVVGTTEGAWKTRAVQRKPFEDSWINENAVLVKMRPHSDEVRDRAG